MCSINDPRTDAFMEVVRDAFRRSRTDDYAGALTTLAPLFEEGAFPELRGRALAYRAILLEKLERFDEVRADLLAALALSQAASQERYTNELGLAYVGRRVGDADAELAWLRRALATAAATSDPTIGGFVAASAVLDRAGDAVSAEERGQIETTIRQGWPILELDGEPDFADLRATLTRMCERSGDKDYGSRRA